MAILRHSDDVMTTMFESETLTMAMGLLTALLTDAKKVSCEVYMLC